MERKMIAKVNKVGKRTHEIIYCNDVTINFSGQFVITDINDSIHKFDSKIYEIKIFNNEEI